MKCLVYVSSATSLLTEAALADILDASHRNNAAASVTGLLLYSGGNILQVLEGEELSVEHLLERIKLDPRHTGLQRLLKFDIARRQFSDWSMALRRPTDFPEDQRVRSIKLVERCLAAPAAEGISHEVRTMVDVFARSMT